MNERDQALHEAAMRLRTCRDMASEPGQQCFRDAYLQVLQLRNRLLQQADHQWLVELNALLSLMASVQFPLAGTHHDRMQAIAGHIEKLVAGSTSAER